MSWRRLRTRGSFGPMSDKHPIRSGVISGVAAGVILAVLSAIWPPAKRAVSYVLRLLTAPVPVWILIAILVAVGGLAFLARRRNPTGHPVGPRSTGAPIDPTPPRLLGDKAVEAIEREILHLLVKANGDPVSVNNIVRKTGAVRLRVQAELERLEANNLVELADEVEEGTTDVFLTSRGRQYCIQLGLL